MPLDSHHHLSRLGWAGQGKALRAGGLTRPLNVSQKRTLAGVGKDRDEAFPFWDHVFTAAAGNVVIRVPKDDSSDSVRANKAQEQEQEQEPDTPPPANTPLQRTSTGIISNRRPQGGTPALSGSSTPTLVEDGAAAGRVSLLALAKQQAARSMLYARFFRGPVLRMEEEEEELCEEGRGGEEGKEQKEMGEGEEVVETLMVQETVMVEVTRKKRKRQDAETGAIAGSGEGKPKKRKRRTFAQDATAEQPTVVAPPPLDDGPAPTLSPLAEQPSGPSDNEKRQKKKKQRSLEEAVTDVDEAERKRAKKRRKEEKAERTLARAASAATTPTPTPGAALAGRGPEPLLASTKVTKGERKDKKKR
ncbi:hypothetical protein CALVIDRAFT_574659 [Calocera viscosa TUFC12733]|uniref:G-patch domain-containing protein n=1 Tax=Calocera viscosa (strain TUFC12733) TaxID=1330018 RepID=A0A167MUE9_CALVF|nr:hypothetical protein CALVIDRAFT_574659 [Calocera viscosa TUFC12733]